MLSKRELRKIIKERKALAGNSQMAVLSGDACHFLSMDKEILSANTIMAYFPMEDELDIRPLLEILIKDRRVLLPVVKGDDIILKELDSIDAMRKGDYGILEPDTDEIFKDFDEIDLILVPGIAFTRDGKRLGRGRGYYDRFLSLVPKSRTYGICFPFQIVDDLPVEPHDRIMDKVLLF